MPDTQPPCEPSDFPLVPKKRSLPKDNPADIPDYVLDNPSRFTLYVTDRVITGLRRYCNIYPETEVGGVLFGRHFRRGDRIVVVVEEHLPLPSQDANRTHFTFDEKALVALHSGSRTPDKYLVGWFHSHPKFGDPFMSNDDITLHKRHWKDSWYVSAVIAVGEWSVPIGFYRMEAGVLINIAEHFLHMTPAISAGEQTRRYFKACMPQEKPVCELMGGLSSLVQDLGVAQDSQLSKLLLPEDSSDEESSGVGGLAPLRLLLNAAKAMAGDSTCLREAAELVGLIRQVTLYEDSTALAASSESLPERIAVYRQICVSLTQGNRTCYCLDFIKNLIWPLGFDERKVLTDLCVSEDGNLWLLTADGQLLLFKDLEDTAVFGMTADSSDVPFKAYKLPLDSTPKRVIALQGSLLVLTDASVYRIKTPTKESAVPIVEGRLVVEGEACVLSHGPNKVGLVISENHGHLVLRSPEGARVGKLTLPEHWQRWRPADACWCAAGLLVLFDDMAAGQLGLFDIESGSLIRHYLQYGARPQRQKVTSIVSDQLGRVFVRKGRAVYLLLETGSLDPGWYHAR